MSSQLPLPLDSCETSARGGFVVGSANAQAAAFLDAWPNGRVSAAALYGPSGSGKSHLASIWSQRSAVRIVAAGQLSDVLPLHCPLVVEDLDAQLATEAVGLALMRLMDSATPSRPLLLTGREAPDCWPCAVPDLASRFAALPAFALAMPDDDLLMAITRQLLVDRQLVVQEAAIRRIVTLVDRSPAAIRSFVEDIDRRALAQSRPVTAAFVGEVIASQSGSLS